jgi:hypothetical protein
MRWIEIIQLRCTAGDGRELASELVAHLEGSSTSIRVYRSAEVAGDLSVHMHHESSSPPDSGVGEQLASELQAFGLTDRTLWVEAAQETSR